MGNKLLITRDGAMYLIKFAQIIIILIFEELRKFRSKSRRYQQHIYRVPRQVYVGITAHTLHVF
jgi:hypothetical protein